MIKHTNRSFVKPFWVAAISICLWAGLSARLASSTVASGLLGGEGAPAAPQKKLATSTTPPQTLKIYQIQGDSAASCHTHTRVQTEGVVTACFFEPKQINGFFLQDTLGDNNPNTSDAIFVYGKAPLKVGDYVSLVATVSETRGRTQLSGYQNLVVHKTNCKIPYLLYKSPADLPENKEEIESMAVKFTKRLYVTNTYNLGRNGQITLSSKPLREPTDTVRPGTEAYNGLFLSNMLDMVELDDASNALNPSPIPFLGKDSTLRLFSYVDSLSAVFTQLTASKYGLYPIQRPVFTENPRKASPIEEEGGEAYFSSDIKIAAFNIENYKNESMLQKSRILKAMQAMDADIYALCEVLQNKEVVRDFVDEFSKQMGCEYKEVAYLDSVGRSIYATVQILYRKDKIDCVKDWKLIKSTPGVKNRRLVQAFKLKNKVFSFILSLNHLKSKTGNPKPEDEDKNDGQGQYNSQRIKEIKAVLAKEKELKAYYASNKILYVGDFNAFSREDPIEELKKTAPVSLLEEFAPFAYTYSYNAQIACLDHAFVDSNMLPYINSALVWHINAAEPSFLDYQNSKAETTDFVYRSSDHDPILIGINAEASYIEPKEKIQRTDLEVFPNPCTSKFTWEIGTSMVQTATKVASQTKTPLAASSVQPAASTKTLKKLSLCDLNSKEVITYEGADIEKHKTIDVSKLPSGLYILKIETDKKAAVAKIIKR